MTVWLAAPLLAVTALLSVLALLRRRDRGADRAEAARLVAAQPTAPAVFDPRTVDDLPAPARRFFRHAIAPGTPLRTVARIEMTGRFGMGDRARPGYMPMRAEQVLAAPEGFVWSMTAGQGIFRLSGSDSGRWTRFRLGGLLPVARFGGTPDHRRSAFGRYVSEAVFWTPAAVLPGADVHWEPVDDDTARVTLHHAGLAQSVDVTVDAAGRAVRVAFDRWSNANKAKRWQMQRFGGTLSGHRRVQGFCLPMHVEAGNHFDTPDYFPFFVVDVTAIGFPASDGLDAALPSTQDAANC